MQSTHYFRQQHGLITTAQTRKAGLTRRQVDRLLATAEWINVHRGVYRLAAVTESMDTRLLAAALATNGVASHLSAASNWGLDAVARQGAEVSVPARKRTTALPGVTIYRTTPWEPETHVMRRGIPTTPIERTLMDCAACVPVAVVERLAESAVRQHLTTWQHIEEHFRKHAARGRTGSATMRELLAIRGEKLPLSDFSRAVAQLLVRAGLPKPHLEHVIRDRDGRHILQVDLAWPELSKACECDGLAYHGGRADIERDYRKRNAARAEGWQIQEILWSMYVDEKPVLIDTMRRFLAC